MHFTKTLTLFLCLTFLSSAAVMAQTNDDEDSASTETPHKHHRKMDMAMGGGDHKPPPVHRWYLGNTFDGAILSTAVFERPGMSRELTTVRFSMMNIGYHFNFDFDEHFGIFSGVSIKNIGFIEKNGDSTTKRRVYTAGVPLGIKIGNLQKRHYGFIGGGVDFPINYREKRFTKRSDKYKFNEFFSDRTDDYMPYVFAGISYGGGTTLKIQYYPSNFLNTGFEENYGGRTVQPYRGYRVNLLYITLGFDMHYKTHEKKADEETVAPAEM